MKSAAASLFAYGGDATPVTSLKDDGVLSPVSLASMAVPPFPQPEDGLASPPHIIGSKATSALGDDSPGLNLPQLNRGNTWASDLDALAEEAGEDQDGSPADVFSGAPESEKRLQDTPFGMGHDIVELHDEGARAAAHSFSSTEASESNDLNTMENMVIKNTFLEFKPKPIGGMRQVQTASGRLDLMSQE